jgi:hypothetical protein
VAHSAAGQDRQTARGYLMPGGATPQFLKSRRKAKIHTAPCSPEEAFQIWLALPGRDRGSPESAFKALRAVIESKTGRKCSMAHLTKWAVTHRWHERAMKTDMEVSREATELVVKSLVQELAEARIYQKRQANRVIRNVMDAAVLQSERILARAEKGDASPDGLNRLAAIIEKMDRVSSRTPMPNTHRDDDPDDDTGESARVVGTSAAEIYAGTADIDALARQVQRLKAPPDMKQIVQQQGPSVIEGKVTHRADDDAAAKDD